MGEGSLVRTSSLQGGESRPCRARCSAPTKLYLSDFGYAANGMDHSTLRVLDLTQSAGFPKQVSQDL